MQNILVINVNWLGDVIFSSPIFPALKTQYPQARLTCLAPSRVQEILECVPGVDNVIVYDEKGAHKSLSAKLQLIWRLRQEKFDAAFILHRSLTRALLPFFAGIPVRVGYDTKNRGIFLTHRYPVPAGNLHRGDFYLKVIENFGIRVSDRTNRLLVGEESRASIRKKLVQRGVTDKDKIVIVNCGGNWDLKRWPADNFTELIKRLMAVPGVRVIVSGADKDRPLVEGVVKNLPVRPVSFAGELNLKELIALMEAAAVVVSNDSGPIHIANAVGTAVVGIFGPTVPEITGPAGWGRKIILRESVPCNQQSCYRLDCRDNECMQAVKVGSVWEAVSSLLKESINV
ncbi:MAG: lipopolysaccharide heptosyltransferase II [Candidatus Omnitrophica bacterium]|nr:lipopolysaccharide heptosyltransferase II [Candidatus Omnitrophota bacterium]